MKAWKGVDPCAHSHLWMHGTKECAPCWKIRFDREWEARFPDENLPFEAGAEEDPDDYAGDEAYADEAKAS